MSTFDERLTRLLNIVSDEEKYKLLENLESAHKKELALEDAKIEIKNLLRDAREALIRAGEVAAEYGISFTFHDPKGIPVSHPGKWMESACYKGDGWYFDAEDDMVAGEYSEWQSSSYNC